MPISGNSVYEMRPTNGNDNNGGGFVEGASGTDYSQQNSPQYALTGIASSGSGNTVLSASAAADMVGNVAQVISGTNFNTGFFQVVSVVVGTSITFSTNAGNQSICSGTGASGVINIGGAVKTFTKLFAAMGTGSRAWVKAESTITSTGNISINYTNNPGLPTWIAGYTTTRGDLGHVTIQAITNTGFQLVSADNNNNLAQFVFRNFTLDCNSLSGVSGYKTNTNGGCAENIKVINLNAGKGFDYGNVQGGCYRNCLVLSPSGGTGFEFTGVSNNIISAIDCQVLGGTNTTAFSLWMGFFLRCIAGNGTGSSNDAFHISSLQGFLHLQNCVAYKWGQDGFSFNNPSNNFTFSFMNNISYGNGRYNVNNLNAGTTALTSGSAMNNYNFVGAGGTADYNGFPAGPNSVTLTADPFTNGASNDFSLNSTAGGGAAVTGAAFPGALQAGGTGHQSGGALEPAAGGGSSGMLYVPNLEGT